MTTNDKGGSREFLCAMSWRRRRLFFTIIMMLQFSLLYVFIANEKKGANGVCLRTRQRSESQGVKKFIEGIFMLKKGLLHYGKVGCAQNFIISEFLHLDEFPLKVDACHRSVSIHNYKIYPLCLCSAPTVTGSELSDRVMCSGNWNNFLAPLNRQKWLLSSCLTSITCFFVCPVCVVGKSETNWITAARSIFPPCEQLKYDLFYLFFRDRIFMRDFASNLWRLS